MSKGRHVRRTRPSDIAVRRYGDGLKPEHERRAIDIRNVFPVLGIKQETAEKRARNLRRKIASMIGMK
jgi:hypothetical protein